MRFRRLFPAIAGSLAIVCGAAQSALACPMCSQSISSGVDVTIPRAYMYSILFMLATLGTLLTAFIVGIYKVVKRYDAIQAARFADEGLFAEAHYAP